MFKKQDIERVKKVAGEYNGNPSDKFAITGEINRMRFLLYYTTEKCGENLVPHLIFPIAFSNGYVNEILSYIYKEFSFKSEALKISDSRMMDNNGIKEIMHIFNKNIQTNELEDILNIWLNHFVIGREIYNKYASIYNIIDPSRRVYPNDMVVYSSVPPEEIVKKAREYMMDGNSTLTKDIYINASQNKFIIKDIHNLDVGYGYLFNIIIDGIIFKYLKLFGHHILRSLPPPITLDNLFKQFGFDQKPGQCILNVDTEDNIMVVDMIEGFNSEPIDLILSKILKVNPIN